MKNLKRATFIAYNYVEQTMPDEGIGLSSYEDWS